MKISIINGENEKFALQGKMYKNNCKNNKKARKNTSSPPTLNGAVCLLSKRKVGNAVVSNRINHYGVG